MPSLIAETGPLAGQQFEVETELTVGRVRGDLVISDPKLSGRHARFQAIGDGGLEVEDLGSTNGTRVDGSLIRGPTQLSHDAVVRIGSTELKVVLDPVQEPADDPPPSAAGPSDHTVVDIDTPPPRPVPDQVVGDDATVVPDPPSDETVVPDRHRETVVPERDRETVVPERESALPPVAAPPPLPASAAADASRPAAADQQVAAFGAFAPPATRRAQIATRSWIPIVLSYATVILAAVALIVYFATR